MGRRIWWLGRRRWVRVGCRTTPCSRMSSGLRWWLFLLRDRSFRQLKSGLNARRSVKVEILERRETKVALRIWRRRGMAMSGSHKCRRPQIEIDVVFFCSPLLVRFSRCRRQRRDCEMEMCKGYYGWDLTVRAECQLERSAKSGDGLTNSHASICK